MKVKGFLLNLLESLIIGVLVGAVVGGFQLGMQYLIKFSNTTLQNHTWWVIILVIISGIILSLLNYRIIKVFPNLDGSGIPSIELGIRHQRQIDWKHEIVLMIVNSYASSLVGFPLGSEGPSVVIGGKIAEMIEDTFHIGDDDTIAMACGTGFGCAFLSPLAGLCYIFEESLHSWKPKCLLRGIIMMGSAIVVTSLINHHHLLSFVGEVLLPVFKEYYIFLILIVVNAVVGMLFTKGVIALKAYFNQHENIKLVKYRGFILFALMLILNYVCLAYMGAGGSLIANISSYGVIWVVLLILVFRYAITILSGAGKVTGGLVIPMMTLGALVGRIVVLVCNYLFGFNLDLSPFIVVVSMCMIFATITHTPITGTALVYSATAASLGYVDALIIIPVTFVSIYLAYLFVKWWKVDDLYEQFMQLSLKRRT
ncbi:MAG: chloride channel protein [Bacilli bacterium]|nr:chloride channel protein [Bacilli bacterium]